MNADALYRSIANIIGPTGVGLESDPRQVALTSRLLRLGLDKTPHGPEDEPFEDRLHSPRYITE
jgi:hypothetical protein